MVNTLITVAAKDVMVERYRQVNVKGFTPEHDDTYADGTLECAAAAYAVAGTGLEPRVHAVLWPWSLKRWKPTDRRRNLVKAGALILAAIERIDRGN